MAKRINRSDHKAVLHFLTINVRDRKRLFAHDACARAALHELRAHCDAHPARLIAYVVMPDHLHCVVNPRDGRITRFLSQCKPAVTHAVHAVALATGQQALLDWLTLPDGHLQLWQEGKHDLYLYSDRLIWQKIDYIHSNPIRWGLVKRAGEYPYSSFAAMYDTGEEVIIPIDRGFWWEDMTVEEAFADPK